MPRSKDRVVIYFRWQGRRLTASGKDRTEAEINKALKLKQLEEDTIILNSSTLVRHWIDEWLETYKYGQVNDSWFRDIKGICKNYIIHEIGNTKLLMVKPLHLQRIINFNTKSKSFNDKLYDIITQIFKTAYENGLTNKNIAENLKKADSIPSTPRRAITDYEREILLKVLKGHRGEIFCYLMLYAGLRPQEAIALLWRDIDLQNGFISINKALKSKGVIKNEPKSSAGRRKIPIQLPLLKILSENKKEPNDYVCVNLKGNRYTKKTYTTMWENIRRLMDIEMGAEVYRNEIVKSVVADDFVIYNLRHTFCTDLQSAGVPINVARELMGHGSIDITSKIYTHHSEISISDALEKMNRFSSSK